MKKKLSNWFWDYTANNWKLTPQSKKIVNISAFIVIAAAVTALTINKKK